MENAEDLPERLFRLYLDDRMSPEQYRQFWQLLATEAAKDRLSGELRSLWETLRFSPDQVPAEVWDRKMQDRILKNRIRLTGNEQAARLPWYNRAGWKVAAMLIILAGMAGIGLLIHRRAPSRQLTLDNPASKESRPGGHRLITLPDGSTAVLNINSKLDYTDGFGKGTREVYLTGEAYFTIRSDRDQPFLVHSGMITTRVLGTAFNVKAYPEESNISVTVTTGKVQVRDTKKDLLVLTPNRQIIYHKETARYEETGINAQTVVNWKEEDLVFDNITMEEATKLIGNRFHVRVVFSNDRLKKCRVTATFLSQHGLEQVLLVLCKLTDASYDQQGDRVTLNGPGCE